MTESSAESSIGEEPGLTTVFIAVGSNLDPENHIPRALSALQKRMDARATSAFYRTAPLRGRNQPLFHNGVWRVATREAPRSIKFDVLRPIEEALGRKRTRDRYASRTIDLDLILHGDCVLDEPDLRLPDPDIFTRPFIAAPLLELAPDLVLPGSGQPLAELEVAGDRSGMEAVPELTRLLREMIGIR